MAGIRSIETTRIAVKAKTDERARSELVTRILPFATQQAKRFAYRYPLPSEISVDDLVSEALRSVVFHAVPRFDAARGHQFLTYAAYWIQQGIQRAAKNPRERAEFEEPSEITEESYGGACSYDPQDYDSRKLSAVVMGELRRLSEMDQQIFLGVALEGRSMSEFCAPANLTRQGVAKRYWKVVNYIRRRCPEGRSWQMEAA